MALTKDFLNTISARAKRDNKFRKATISEDASLVEWLDLSSQNFTYSDNEGRNSKLVDNSSRAVFSFSTSKVSM